MITQQWSTQEITRFTCDQYKKSGESWQQKWHLGCTANPSPLIWVTWWKTDMKLNESPYPSLSPNPKPFVRFRMVSETLTINQINGKGVHNLKHQTTDSSRQFQCCATFIPCPLAELLCGPLRVPWRTIGQVRKWGHDYLAAEEKSVSECKSQGAGCLSTSKKLRSCCYRYHVIIKKHVIMLLLLMDKILHHQGWWLSHYLYGFNHPRWCRILSINSMNWIFLTQGIQWYQYLNQQIPNFSEASKPFASGDVDESGVNPSDKI